MRSINFFSVLLIISAIVFLPANLFSRVSIGSTDSPQDFSVLELFSNETMGFRLPQLDYEQRNALTPILAASPRDSRGVSAAMGLQIFNTTHQCVETWNGEDWISLCDGDEPPFITPPHFEADCRVNPAVANCFAELRRFSSTVRRLADVTNPGNHAANAQSFTANGVIFNMMPVTGGVFYKGAQRNPALPNFDSIASPPVIQVGVSSFFMSQTEVTRELFAAVMGASGLFGTHQLTAVSFIAPTHPPGLDVGNLAQNRISWFQAIVFSNRLSVITGRTPVYTHPTLGISDFLNASPPVLGDDPGVIAAWNNIEQNLLVNGFRLPTEAEWQYAARGGQRNEYTRTLGASGEQYRFSGDNNADLVSWHDAHPNTNFGTETRPVGRLAPNDLGIFDMSGNVWEWVWDLEAERPICCVVNPTGPYTTTMRSRLILGGSWADPVGVTRITIRNNHQPTAVGERFGLRLAASAP